MRTLDRFRSFAECTGGPERYEQDGIFFDARGQECLRDAQEVQAPPEDDSLEAEIDPWMERRLAALGKARAAKAAKRKGKR